MNKLYSIITMGDLSGKEITLPSGKYHINNNDTIESDEARISLSLPVPDSSLCGIEIELYENYYYVSCITHSNDVITMDICYNTPFSYRGKPFFAIKEQHDTWSGDILSVKGTTGSRRRSRRLLFYVLLILSAILTAGFISGKNKNNTDANNHTINHEDIIRRHTNNNEYIIKNNNILVFTSTENSINQIKNDLPGYTIYSVNRSDIKKDKNDIVTIPDINKRKEIIYIHDKNKTVNPETLTIPDEFRDDITIKTLSFSDIVKLINDRFGKTSIRYSVKKSGNIIFIYADTRRNKETDDIIKDINTTIFSSPGNTLVQYREITPRETLPGVYGSVNYIRLSDNHTKFISDNK